MTDLRIIGGIFLISALMVGLLASRLFFFSTMWILLPWLCLLVIFAFAVFMLSEWSP